MSIISSPEQITERATSAINTAAEWARGWDAVAAFLTAHPDIAESVGTAVPSGEWALGCVSGHDDPASFIASAAQACVDAGGRVEQYRSVRFGGVRLWFGPVYVQVYADLDQVFTRRVVGMVEQVEYTPTFDLPQAAGAVA